MSGRRATAGALALVIGFLAGCGPALPPTTSAERVAMWHIDEGCDFSKWNWGDPGAHGCHPRLDDAAFRGIALNAPQEVEVDPAGDAALEEDGTWIPLCGVWRFEYGTEGIRTDFLPEILFVAADTRTHEVYSGRYHDELDVEPVEMDDDDDAEFRGAVLSETFDVDLVRTLGLPLAPAEYVVHAVLGEYKSNTVRIRVGKRD